jgi:hypothetical protein
MERRGALHLFQFVAIGFYDEVREQFLASGLYFFLGLGGIGGIKLHMYVAAYAHVGHIGELEVLEVVQYGFALWVQKPVVGHNVYFC